MVAKAGARKQPVRNSRTAPRIVYTTQEEIERLEQWFQDFDARRARSKARMDALLISMGLDPYANPDRSSARQGG